MVRRMMGLLALAAAGVSLGFGVPAAAAQSGSGAVAVTAQTGGGDSNYYAEDPGYYEPTTTVAPTTTAKATTTTAAPTTTVATTSTAVTPSVPVSVENQVVTAAPQPATVARAMPAELAYTGTATPLLVAIAAAAIALGVVARRAARR